MADNRFARFIVESSKKRPSGRTALYTAPNTLELSVFTADPYPNLLDDLRDAGRYVARKMNKTRLHGWSYMVRSAFESFDLTIVAAPDNVVFGLCQHMNVCGWPADYQSRLRIAQDLSELENDRHIEPKPLPV